ncbi:MAG: hypothetical protein IH600_15150 [Bacteroidetes bacterium]|nr:hypothetical protein [Bacteroidota bacterium]
MNDMDTTSMRTATQSDPMGLEVHTLIWDAPLQDAVCFRITYINKSRDSITDAYVSHFVQFDMRETVSDRPASDSSRAMVYAYEDTDYRASEGPPTAFGACFLQTPRAAAAADDVARWNDGYVRGYRNLPLSGAVMPVMRYYDYPALKEPGDDMPDTPERWHAFAEGRALDGSVLNPRTGGTSRFWYDGDPVSGEGWLCGDGLRSSGGTILPAGTFASPRMMISSGPFAMAPGDTQQVVFAWFFNRTATPESGVHMLRAQAEAARAVHLFPDAPTYSGAEIRGYDRESALLSAWATSPDGNKALTAAAYRHGVKVSEDIPLQSVFSIPKNAWLYSAQFPLPRSAEGIDVHLTEHRPSGDIRLPGAASLPLSGDLRIEGFQVLEDENDDNIISKDESARLFPRLRYEGTTGIGGLHLIPGRSDDPLSIDSLPPESWFPSEIASGAEGWGIENGFIQFAPSRYGWSRGYHVYSRHQNMMWERSFSIDVDSSEERETWDALMEHVSGPSTQQLGVRILDADALQNRWYVASLRFDSIPATPFSQAQWYLAVDVEDSLTAAALVRGYGLTSFSGPMKTLDGFRVTKGNAFPERPTGWQFSIGPGSWGYFTDSHMHNAHVGHSSTMSIYTQGREAIAPDMYPSLRLLVGGPFSQKAYYYVDSSFAGMVDVPVICEGIHRDGRTRQLDLLLFDRTPDIDGGWSRNQLNTLLVLSSDYSIQEKDANTAILLPSRYTMPVLPEDTRLYAGFQLITDSLITAEPDTVMLDFHYEISPADRYRYNPFASIASRTQHVPEHLFIGSPYPNPSAGGVRLPLDLPLAGTVRAELFDILGRRIRTLYDLALPAGKHLLPWEGLDMGASPVPPGTYIIRVMTLGTVTHRRVLLVR